MRTPKYTPMAPQVVVKAWMECKAILELLFALLIMVTFSFQASATAYVQAQKVYLGADGYAADGGSAANANAQAVCNGVYPCNGTYDSEYYDYSMSSWYWLGTMHYTLTYLDPPNPPKITQATAQLGGIITFNCPPGFAPYNVLHPGLCSGPDPVVPPPPPQ